MSVPGFQLAFLRSDCTKHYAKLHHSLKSIGAVHEFTDAYEGSSNNGMVKYPFHYKFSTSRVLLLTAGLSQAFEPQSLEYTRYLHNRTPHSGINL